MALGLVSLALCFHKSITKIGQVFYMFVSGISLTNVGLSFLRLKFIWGGSTNIVTWTYIPAEMSRALVYGFSGFGLLLIVIAFVRAIDLGTQQVVSSSKGAFGKRPSASEVLRGEYE